MNVLVEHETRLKQRKIIYLVIKFYSGEEIQPRTSPTKFDHFAENRNKNRIVSIFQLSRRPSSPIEGRCGDERSSKSLGAKGPALPLLYQALGPLDSYCDEPHLASVDSFLSPSSLRLAWSSRKPGTASECPFDLLDALLEMDLRILLRAVLVDRLVLKDPPSGFSLDLDRLPGSGRSRART